MGAFITLEKPTRPMKTEALAAGFYEPEFYPSKRFQKIQILTIEELLDGKELDYLKRHQVTFKAAKRKSKKKLPKNQRSLL